MGYLNRQLKNSLLKLQKDFKELKKREICKKVIGKLKERKIKI